MVELSNPKLVGSFLSKVQDKKDLIQETLEQPMSTTESWSPFEGMLSTWSVAMLTSRETSVHQADKVCLSGLLWVLC